MGASSAIATGGVAERRADDPPFPHHEFWT
jgi:hypothetical protein